MGAMKDSMIESVIDYRPACADDRAFVCDAWASSFRTSFAAGVIDMEHWHGIMWAQVERYIDRPHVQTVLAVSASDPSFIYGFIAADPTEHREHGGRPWDALVYYLFVKAPFRQRGIARGLFAEAGIEPRGRWLYACKTPTVVSLATKIPMAKWNPLAARFPKDES